MPRPRLSLKWLLVAVAIAAAMTWALRLRHLSRSYRDRAAAYRADQALWERGVRMSEAEVARRTAEWNDLESRAQRDRGQGLPEVAKNWEDLASLASRGVASAVEDARTRRGHRDRSARLARKYERAARSPWVPVEPDPPGPE